MTAGRGCGLLVPKEFYRSLMVGLGEVVLDVNFSISCTFLLPVIDTDRVIPKGNIPSSVPMSMLELSNLSLPMA